MIKTGIIGGAGYTGGELIRLLIQHPAAEIVFVHSKSNAGNHFIKSMVTFWRNKSAFSLQNLTSVWT
jgi:N-acetyl-gamma-glutamylphosphate reductase